MQILYMKNEEDASLKREQLYGLNKARPGQAYCCPTLDERELATPTVVEGAAWGGKILQRDLPIAGVVADAAPALTLALGDLTLRVGCGMEEAAVGLRLGS